MAVHIFTVSEVNYKICIERGLVALPDANEGWSHDNVFDGLALKQLINYEYWFLQKVVAGDYNKVRITTIARYLSPETIKYVSQRDRIEDKSKNY